MKIEDFQGLWILDLQNGTCVNSLILKMLKKQKKHGFEDWRLKIARACGFLIFKIVHLCLKNKINHIFKSDFEKIPQDSRGFLWMFLFDFP